MSNLRSAIVAVIAVTTGACAWKVMPGDGKAHAQEPATGRFQQITFVNAEGATVALLEAKGDELLVRGTEESHGAVAVKFSRAGPWVDVRGTRQPGIGGHVSLTPLLITIDNTSEYVTRLTPNEVSLCYRLDTGEVVPLVQMESRENTAGFYLHSGQRKSLMALDVAADNPLNLAARDWCSSVLTRQARSRLRVRELIGSLTGAT